VPLSAAICHGLSRALLYGTASAPALPLVVRRQKCIGHAALA
jgi:hypothetical protein